MDINMINDAMELQRALGRVEGKMDSANEKIDRLLLDLGTTDARLGSLERWRAYTLGLAAGVAGVVSAITTIILSSL